MGFKVGGVLGFVTWLIATIAFFYFTWRSDMRPHEAHLAENIEMLRPYFGASQVNKQFTISYEKIRAAGFPFNDFVRVEKPVFAVTVPGGRFLLSMDYVDFEVGEELHAPYRLDYLPQALAQLQRNNGTVENYALLLSEVPQIVIRRSISNNKLSPRFNEWMIALPPQLLLSISKSGLSKTVPFKVPPYTPTYTRLPQHLRHYMLYLHALVVSQMRSAS